MTRDEHRKILLKRYPKRKIRKFGMGQDSPEKIESLRLADEKARRMKRQPKTAGLRNQLKRQGHRK